MPRSISKKQFSNIYNKFKKMSKDFDAKKSEKGFSLLDSISGARTSLDKNWNNKKEHSTGEKSAYMDSKIALYTNAQIKASKRGFFEKLFHPIRTYRENQMLKNMKAELTTKFDITDKVLDSIVDISKETSKSDKAIPSYEIGIDGKAELVFDEETEEIIETAEKEKKVQMEVAEGGPEEDMEGFEIEKEETSITKVNENDLIY